jgi:hypothetical protein
MEKSSERDKSRDKDGEKEMEMKRKLENYEERQATLTRANRKLE